MRHSALSFADRPAAVEAARAGAGRPALALLLALAPVAAGAAPSAARAEEPFATLGPASCAQCHEEQNRWWFKDAHFRTADPLFERRARYVQVGTLSGLRGAEIARGDRGCADCHGTVVTGREDREAQDGVGCESCHGPAERWLEPHKEGERSPGADRPGYLRALGQGMRDLRRLEVRAEVCTRCHYITTPRLLSAGHPSGLGFDFVRGMDEVRHWESPAPDAAEIRQAFGAAQVARGRPPAVDRSAALRPAPELGRRLPRRSWRQGRLPRARILDPVEVRPDREEAGLELPPFPALTEETTLEEGLRAVRGRLELLYRTVGRP